MPAADASNPIEAVRARLDGGRKWLKRGFEEDGAACLAHACRQSSPEVSVRNRARDVLIDVVSEQYPEFAHDSSPIVCFNDARDTTWADVDLVLDKAARKWDEQVRP